MKIGEIATQSGFSKDTLRYYEKIGLIQLSKHQRSEKNYRIYDDSNLQELLLIKKMKSIGFTLNEIKDIKRMEVLNSLSCTTLSPIVQNKLAKIEAQMAILLEQKRKLLALVSACQGDCLDAFEEGN